MKKAVFFTIGTFITYVIFLVIVLLTLLAMTNAFVQVKTNIQAAEEVLFEAQLLKDIDGMMYFDYTAQKFHAGVIDLNNFNSERLDSAMHFDDNNIIAARLELFLEDGTSREAYFNRERYNRWKPLVGTPGSGSASRFEENLQIQYMENDIIKPGRLRIEALLPGRT